MSNNKNDEVDKILAQIEEKKKKSKALYEKAEKHIALSASIILVNDDVENENIKKKDNEQEL
jgi:hypothetical protein